MTRPLLQSLVSVLLLAVAVSLPWLAHEDVQQKQRDLDQALQHQHSEQSRIAADHRHLADLLLQAQTPLSPDERQQLNRLRSHASELRECLNQVKKLKEENTRLQAGLPSSELQSLSPNTSREELDQQLNNELFGALQKLVRELPRALDAFARDHTNRPPANLIQLKDYFENAASPGSGLYTFELASPAPVPAASPPFLLREQGAHEKPGGKWGRYYATTDGQITEAISEDGNFDAWEQARTRALR